MVLGLINYTYKYLDNSMKNEETAEKEKKIIFFEKNTYAQFYLVMRVNLNIFKINTKMMQDKS